MKKLLPVFILGILVVGGIVTYDRYQMSVLSGKLTQNTAAIVKGYEDLIDTTIVPLEKSNALTEKQKHVVQQLTVSRAALLEEKQIPLIVSDIHDIQLSLMSFLQDLQPDQSFVDSAEVALLQKEMGKAGKMRDVLNAYNDTAAEWNNHIQSGVEGLQASIIGQNNAILPYLRFDGEQEYLTSVHL